MNHLATGKAGEEAARRFLERQGFNILASNFRCPIGELDLVVQQGRMIRFVEVKSASKMVGDPEDAVNHHKRRKLTLLAKYFIQQRRLDDYCFQFDVVAVRNASGPTPQVEHYPDAFEPLD